MRAANAAKSETEPLVGPTGREIRFWEEPVSHRKLLGFEGERRILSDALAMPLTDFFQLVGSYG
jgi:hypothetical protein